LARAAASLIAKGRVCLSVTPCIGNFDAKYIGN